MPISTEHVGRSYPPTAPYQVSTAKIIEFATAIGETDPRYRGDQPVAPPTFVAVVVTSAWQAMFDDPELGLALHRIVHAEQRFSYRRPLVTGDRVVATLTIDKVRSRDTADFITTSAEVRADSGELVCTATATFVHSKEAR